MEITFLCRPKFWKSWLGGTGSESCPPVDFALSESSRIQYSGSSCFTTKSYVGKKIKAEDPGRLGSHTISVVKKMLFMNNCNCWPLWSPTVTRQTVSCWWSLSNVVQLNYFWTKSSLQLILSLEVKNSIVFYLVRVLPKYDFRLFMYWIKNTRWPDENDRIYVSNKKHRLSCNIGL
jgi:hypothetical protein